MAKAGRARLSLVVALLLTQLLVFTLAGAIRLPGQSITVEPPYAAVWLARDSVTASLRLFASNPPRYPGCPLWDNWFVELQKGERAEARLTLMRILP